MPKSMPRNGDSEASEIPDEDVRLRHAQRFISRTFRGQRTGHIRVGTSEPGNPGSFTSWTVKIPGPSDDQTRVIADLIEKSHTLNVFICSAVFDGLGQKVHNVIGGRWVWLDIDPPHHKDKSIDWERMPEHRRTLKTAKRELRKLGAKITRSGSPGGIHARIQLSRMASRDELRAINWLLADVFHGDSKWSPEALLRLPGTLNHKSDPPAYVEPEFDVLPGRAKVHKAHGTWEPGELVKTLAPDLSLTSLVEVLSAPKADEDAEDEPFDHNRYSGVLASIEGVNERFQAGEYGSRYKAAVGVVKDCMAAGLSVGNAIHAARQCAPLVDKEEDERGYSIAKDVSRVWVRESANRHMRSTEARRRLDGDDEVPETFQSAAATASRPSSSVVPVQSLTGKFREYVLAVAKSYQVTPEYVTGLCLATLSVASGRAYRVHRRENWKESLVIWFLHLSGPSTRKSDPMEHVMAPIQAKQNQLRSQHAKTAFIRKRRATIAKKKLADLEKGETSGVVMPEELRPADIKEIQQLEEAIRQGEMGKPTLIATDTTPAKLATTMVENGGKLAVFDDETSYLENMAGMYSSGKADTSGANKAYRESTWEVSRQGRGEVEVRRAYLPTCIAAQPDAVAGILKRSPKLIGSGFIARFLMSMPPERRKGDYIAGLEYDVPKALDDWWEKTLNRIMARAETVVEQYGQAMIHLDDEAREAFIQWEARCLDDLMFENRYAAAKENLGKLVGATLRIAGLLSIVEGKKTITKDIMKRAILLGEHYAAQAAKVMNYFRANGGGAKKITEQLPEAVNDWVTRIAQMAKRREKTLSKSPFTKSAFHQAIKRHLKDTDYQEAKAFYDEIWPLLEKHDVVILVDEETPYPKYELGPGLAIKSTA